MSGEEATGTIKEMKFTLAKQWNTRATSPDVERLVEAARSMITCPLNYEDRIERGATESEVLVERKQMDVILDAWEALELALLPFNKGAGDE